MMRSRTIGRCLATRGVAIVLSLLLFSSSMLAQATDRSSPPRVLPWTLIEAVGYGGAGTLVGFSVAAAAVTGPEAAALTILGSAAVGVAVGGVMGWRTSSRLRSQQPISNGQQFRASLGAVLAGATVGAIAAGTLSNGEAFVPGAALGGAAGLLLAVSQQRSLRAYRVDISPYRARDGSTGLSMRVQR